MTSIETEGDPQYWLSGKDVITPERKKARNAIAVEGERGGRQLRSLTDPLDFYVAKGQISERQYDAGEKLQQLWRKGTKSPFAQARYGDGEGNGGMPEYFPIGMFAIDYRTALDSIRGLHEKKVAHFVCCEHIAASRCLQFSSRRTAERKGMQYLHSALDDLARHFKC